MYINFWIGLECARICEWREIFSSPVQVWPVFSKNIDLFDPLVNGGHAYLCWNQQKIHDSLLVKAQGRPVSNHPIFLRSCCKLWCFGCIKYGQAWVRGDEEVLRRGRTPKKTKTTTPTTSTSNRPKTNLLLHFFRPTLPLRQGQQVKRIKRQSHFMDRAWRWCLGECGSMRMVARTKKWRCWKNHRWIWIRIQYRYQ